MKKLRLQIEKLSIEQFEVQQAPTASPGTVQGLMMSTPDGCSGRPFCLPMPITYSCNETECR
jgi:hypothetical protein